MSRGFIQVIRPGAFTTIQDDGRSGFQRWGVVVGGALDDESYRLANLLVGNNPNDAALEMTLLGAWLQFEQPALIALCGAELAATVDGSPVPLMRPVLLRGGALLECGPMTSGCRAYLAIAGGFDVPLVLGSRSTYMRASIGGLEGRSLRSGDRLPVGEISPRSAEMLRGLLTALADSPIASTSWRLPSMLPPTAPAIILRTMPGSEFEWLTPESQISLFASAYEVTVHSDRMGYRLAGPRLSLTSDRQLLSEGVTAGTVQVPLEGQPIALMADCATTGGYAKVAHVATVDLPLLAQARPGDKVRFVQVTIEEAQRALRDKEDVIQRIALALTLRQTSAEVSDAD